MRKADCCSTRARVCWKVSIFTGVMLNYILENKLYFKDYVEKYTNAAFVVGVLFSVVCPWKGQCRFRA